MKHYYIPNATEYVHYTLKTQFRMFRRMDDDHSKQLGYEEFRKGVHDTGLELGEEECRSVLGSHWLMVTILSSHWLMVTILGSHWLMVTINTEL